MKCGPVDDKQDARLLMYKLSQGNYDLYYKQTLSSTI